MRRQPNILVVIVDQLRFPEGSFDQSLMDQAAPNLARLRRQSVSFDAHYAAATACSPSRACMVTGLYTQQNGIFLTNLESFAGVPPTPDLNPGFPTYGSILGGDMGYSTFWWGKWHLSTHCRLDEYGFQKGALPCPSPNGSPGQGLAVDPQIADLFIDWLDSYHDSRPWCTTVSLVNPHDIQWYPRFTRQAPPIPQFHAGLPSNFERWPEALFEQGKPWAQAAWALVSDVAFGVMRYRGPSFEHKWYELLDLYYLLTQDVDTQVGRVLRSLARSKYAENTIVVFTADHGEYGGAHGLHGKAFAVYEESIRVPLYIKDPTSPNQAGTHRTELTSHVDLVPLLMTLATGNDRWRRQRRYAHLAGRADLVKMLKDPKAKGRDYILHTSDEEVPEEWRHLGLSFRDVLVRHAQLPAPLGRHKVPAHVIGYRTRRAKLGLYSNWAPGTVRIVPDGQQVEMYDYARYGTAEVINNAPGGSMPETELFCELYRALFDPDAGAVASELFRPLPAHLRPVHEQAIADYLVYENWI